MLAGMGAVLHPLLPVYKRESRLCFLDSVHTVLHAPVFFTPYKIHDHLITYTVALTTPKEIQAQREVRCLWWAGGHRQSDSFLCTSLGSLPL